jgi:hypothetical protein
VKAILAANVQRLIDHHGQSVPDAARHIKMQPFQLKRVIQGAHAVTMDTLQRIADGYGVEPYQLLVLGLDPANPQVLRALSPQEEALYKALEAARQPGTQ